jgi:ribosomal protein S18 acetylase RimI-like enzyme
MQPLIEITAAAQIDEEIVEAILNLLPQLNDEVSLPDREQLSDVAEADCTVLLLARRVDTGAIVGTATLIVYRVPSGLRAMIEDVVVDVAARGYGVGEALMRDAMLRAAERGAEVVDLTSHAARTAANRLYRKLGFQVRQTNAYRCELTRVPEARTND